MRRILTLSLLALVMVIGGTGCSMWQPQAPLPPTLKKQQQLKQWQVSGKVGIRTAEDAGSAYLKWDQNNNEYHIRLHGPLGQGALDITGGPQKVTARSHKLGEVSAPTPEQLFFEHFGWWMPLSKLTAWIRGLPAQPLPRKRSLELDEQGLIRQFRQSGWQIQYPDYQNVEGITLPRKIILQRRKMTIKLILKEWQFTG